DHNLERNIRQPIQLGPLSLWRSYLVLTTVGPGGTSLNVGENGAAELIFDFEVDSANARDAREALLIRNLKDEQDRFKGVFSNLIGQFKAQIEMAARYRTDDENADLDALDFEMRIQRN